MEFVDTHSHIHSDKYGLNADEVLERARIAGVTRVICVGTTLADSRAAKDFADSHEEVWATAGVHPHDAQSYVGSPSNQDQLRGILNKSSIVAVGEIGLDYYKNYSSRVSQQKALRLQIEAGLPTGLPFVFHVREAWDDFWRILDGYTDLKGVIHSFSSTPDHLEEALSRGLYVGLNGIMTFTTDEQQLAAAKAVPANKLLLETDAPFLTPAPERGKICEPKHTRNVAEFLSELRQEPLEKLAAATTRNAVELFELKSRK
ncbi:MAG: TatD family hydrolase [Candidatus Saccharimonadales bacterium]